MELSVPLKRLALGLEGQQLLLLLGRHQLLPPGSPVLVLGVKLVHAVGGAVERVYPAPRRPWRGPARRGEASSRGARQGARRGRRRPLLVGVVGHLEHRRDRALGIPAVAHRDLELHFRDGPRGRVVAVHHRVSVHLAVVRVPGVQLARSNELVLGGAVDQPEEPHDELVDPGSGSELDLLLERAVLLAVAARLALRTQSFRRSEAAVLPDPHSPQQVRVGPAWRLVLPPPQPRERVHLHGHVGDVVARGRGRRLLLRRGCAHAELQPSADSGGARALEERRLALEAAWVEA
mmetsp:Transcript_121575/g.330289  ORF Transcript_121575/g.330289 Transcript_121575/m.330289 type:complete len:292 (+) Transcript_121575:2175-3050(+)